MSPISRPIPTHSKSIELTVNEKSMDILGTSPNGPGIKIERKSPEITHLIPRR